MLPQNTVFEAVKIGDPSTYKKRLDKLFPIGTKIGIVGICKVDYIKDDRELKTGDKREVTELKFAKNDPYVIDHVDDNGVSWDSGLENVGQRHAVIAVTVTGFVCLQEGTYVAKSGSLDDEDYRRAHLKVTNVVSVIRFRYTSFGREYTCKPQQVVFKLRTDIKVDY